MLVWLFVFLISLLGCASDPTNPILDEGPPNQELALEIVREELSNNMNLDLPSIEIPIIWMRGRCLEGLGYKLPRCVKGIYAYRDFKEDRIYLIFQPKFFLTGFTHELIHGYQAMGFAHDADATHHHDWWENVGLINQVLKELDL